MIQHSGISMNDIKEFSDTGAKTLALAVLTVVAVALLATGTAGAERTITSCQEINATNDGGGLVELGSDISATGDCIEINTSDVVFDGQFNTVTGPGSSGIGIEVNATSAGGGATNVTVKDVKVVDFDRGIQYDDNGPGAGGEITNVRVAGNSYGLFAEGGVSVNVTNSLLVSNGAGARGDFAGRFEGNDISNNSILGLFLQDTAQVVDNEIKNNGGPGIRVSGSDTRITDNEIVNNERSGVYVERPDVVVQNNLVTDNNQAFDRGGIYVENAPDVEITNNRVHRNRDYGVRARDAPGLLVQDNRITENCGGQVGLFIEGDVTDVTVERNNVSNNTGAGMIVDGVLTPDATVSPDAVDEPSGDEEVVTNAPVSSPMVRDIEADENGGLGVGVNTPDAVLDDITAVGNGNTGIALGSPSVGAVINNSEVRENGFGTGGDRTGIDVRADDVVIRDTVTVGNDMDISTRSRNTTLENVDLGSATVSGTATEVEINGTPVSVPADPNGVENAGAYFNATNTTQNGYFDATVGYGSAANVDENSLALWKNNGSWTELGGSVDTNANEVSYNITSFSSFGVFGETTDCIDRRSLGRGQEDQLCPSDRTISRGESRSEVDRRSGRNSDTARRDRGRRSLGR